MLWLDGGCVTVDVEDDTVLFYDGVKMESVRIAMSDIPDVIKYLQAVSVPPTT